MDIKKLADQPTLGGPGWPRVRNLFDLSEVSPLNQSMAEVSLAAGHSLHRHMHRTSEEVFFFLEGRGVIEVGGELSAVEAGTAVLIPAGISHGLQAEADIRAIVTSAPAFLEEDTVFE